MRAPRPRDGHGSRPAGTDPRRCARRFTQAISRVEEALLGERPTDDRVTLTSVIAGLEWASCTPAPRAVLSARTGAALHSALLDWQDATEIRDGRREREPEVEVRRTPDSAALGVRPAGREPQSGAPVRRSPWARGRADP